MAAPNEHVDEGTSALPDRIAPVAEAGIALVRIPGLSEVSLRSWRIIALASSLAVTAALVLALALGAPASGGASTQSTDGSDPTTLTQERQDAIALADLVEPLRWVSPARVGAAEHSALVEALDALGVRARACCDASLDSARVAVEIAVERMASSAGSIGRGTYDAAAPSTGRDALGAALATLDGATGVDARVSAVVQVVDLGAALEGAPEPIPPGGADPGAGAGAPTDAGGSTTGGGPADPWATGRGSGSHGDHGRDATPLPAPPEESAPATEPAEPSTPPTDPATTPPPSPPASGGTGGGGTGSIPGGAPGPTSSNELPVAG